MLVRKKQSSSKYNCICYPSRTTLNLWTIRPQPVVNYFGERPCKQLNRKRSISSVNYREDTDMDEIMYRLYVLDKVRKGRDAVEQGKTITSEALKRAIDSW